jgi:hypothetical protein
MGTFSGKATNAKADTAAVDKDNPTLAEVKAADGSGNPAEGEPEAQKIIPAENPQEPTEILDETQEERADRHVASTEMDVELVTDPVSQEDSPMAQAVKGLIIPGAAIGPDFAGNVRNDEGKIAYALPGTLNAAMNGVQQDAAGHVDSVHTDNSSASGVRI